MNDPHRIATYLRLIAGELDEAKDEIDVDFQVGQVLDESATKLRDLADAVEAADVQ